MPDLPRPPKAFQEFVSAFPEIGDAWDLIRKAGARGPLDEKTARLAKLAAAVGSRQTGAVHSATRKAKAAGITRGEMEQVVALAAAATIGLPAAVAAHGWILEQLEKE